MVYITPLAELTLDADDFRDEEFSGRMIQMRLLSGVVADVNSMSSPSLKVCLVLSLGLMGTYILFHADGDTAEDSQLGRTTGQADTSAWSHGVPLFRECCMCTRAVFPSVGKIGTALQGRADNYVLAHDKQTPSQIIRAFIRFNRGVAPIVVTVPSLISRLDDRSVDQLVALLGSNASAVDNTLKDLIDQKGAPGAECSVILP